MEEKQNMSGVQNVTSKSTPTPVQAPATPAAPVKTPAAPAPVAPSAAPAPATKPKAEEPNMMTQGVSTKKKGKGAILGMVLLGILAVGGISFGVWEMLDANTQKEQLNSQISALKQQNNELRDKESTKEELVDSGAAISDNSSALQNPLITVDAPEMYALRFNQSISNVGGEGLLSIFIKDGMYERCMLSASDNCSISGLPNNIFKVATIEFGNGGDPEIGFITQDGSVWYIPVRSENGEYAAKKLEIDGFVKDIIPVEYSADTNNPVGSHRSTLFLLSDGTFVNYEKIIPNS